MIRIKNNTRITLSQIPVLKYGDFVEQVFELLHNPDRHCTNYYAFPTKKGLQFLMLIADDRALDIVVLSHAIEEGQTEPLLSLTSRFPALHIFEREIHENYGVTFTEHPWLKPVRFPHNRANQQQKVNDYPFYSIKSEELHEVGVGPVHAGIIEPGHFRFICNGENVLHLEIQLGWQHRGVEQLFLDKKQGLQRNILAENIAGDTAVGHALTFVQVMEALANKEVPEQLSLERALALELERMAIHTGDIAALCVDAAYHLGANIFGILRTPIVNFLQRWCGNRLGKGLIRLAGTHFPFTEELRTELLTILADFEKRFDEMAALTFRLPSIQNRFEKVGIVNSEQLLAIGTVGPAARMAGVQKDVRVTHPNAAYLKFPYEMATAESGDVFARFFLRKQEIKHSLDWIRKVLANYSFSNEMPSPDYALQLEPNSLAVSLTEAWRGEVCHCAISDEKGNLKHYKVKDPSMHNWKALELSLRNVEISDFPINNKSYNLSYCGYDL